MVLRMPIVLTSSLPAFTRDLTGQPLLAYLRRFARIYRENTRYRRDRAELAQMSSGELNDLGISRGDIPALMDAPENWCKDTNQTRVSRRERR